MKATFLFLLLAYAGLASAGQARSAGQDGAPCAVLMTEAECRQHRQVMAELTDPEARQAYLAEHQAMLRERAALCGGQGRRQVMARLP